MAKSEQAVELEEYKKLVESAAENDSNVSIPNSDKHHAKILFEVMLPKAKRFVHLYTGMFDEIFYDSLKSLFKDTSKRVEVHIVSHNKIPEHIKIRFGDNIKFDTAKFMVPNHFMVVDSKMFRFEEEHPSDKTDKIEAIANFNDPEIANGLESVFKKLYAA